MSNFIFQLLSFLLLLTISFFAHADCDVLFSNVESLPQTEKLSYQSVKNYIQKLGIKTRREFENWIRSGKGPKGFPSHPEEVYKSEWISWGEFLGTGNISSHRREWMNYQSAQNYIQSQGLKTAEEFVEWIKSEEDLPNIPINPSQIYKKEWKSWEEFFGLLGLNDTSSEKFISVSDKTKINGNNFENESKEFVDNEDFLIDYGEDEILKQDFFDSGISTLDEEGTTGF